MGIGMDIKEIAERYNKYGYYIPQYTSECIYSLISDISGSLVEIDKDDWIMDISPNFNLYSCLVGSKGTGKSTTINKFKNRIYSKVIEGLTTNFSLDMVRDNLSIQTLEGLAPTGEGLTKQLSGMNGRVIRIIGTEFGKTMSQMFGNSYLSLLPTVFIKLHDGDVIDRFLTGGNVHIEGGKFTTMMIDLHPQDLDNIEYIEGGLGRRTNLAIYKGKLIIPDLSVETAKQNKSKVEELDAELIKYLVERFSWFFRAENDPKPKIRFNREALQILLNLSNEYGTDSDLSIQRYPTVLKYAILEAIINSPYSNNTLMVDKECIMRAMNHLNQYQDEQKEISFHIKMGVSEERVNMVIEYVNKKSYEDNGNIKFVMHSELLRNFSSMNGKQLQEVEKELAQSRKCYVITYKSPKKKPRRMLAKGDIPENVIRTYLDREENRNGWEKYEIEGDT